MAILDALIGPVISIIDKVIPNPAQRDKAKLELLQLQGSQELTEIQSRLSAIVAEANSHDPWTSRARPSFLYVMYILLLWALPMGLLAMFSPGRAQAIAAGMNAYLSGLPEPLYALFGTGYLGYTAARQWGKIAGSDKKFVAADRFRSALGKHCALSSVIGRGRTTGDCSIPEAVPDDPPVAARRAGAAGRLL